MTRIKILPALLLAVVLSFSAIIPAASPASASTYHLYYNQISSAKLVIGGCYMRLWYGDFGGYPFAKIRYYAGSNCGTMLPTVVYDRGSGAQVHGLNRSNSSGTDSCGTYLETQDTYPGVAFSIAMVVTGAPGTDPAFGQGYSTNYPYFAFC